LFVIGEEHHHQHHPHLGVALSYASHTQSCGMAHTAGFSHREAKQPFCLSDSDKFLFLHPFFPHLALSALIPNSLNPTLCFPHCLLLDLGVMLSSCLWEMHKESLAD